MTLFHGSPTYIGDGWLKPHVSFDGKPLVYASSDFYYSVIRCGRFSYDTLYMREDRQGGKYTLCELRPNAFKDVFDHTGWVYVFMEGDGFTKQGDEYVADHPKLMSYSVRIDNVLKEIKDHPEIYELHYYEDDNTEYWNRVNGGKEGYLKRRAAAVERYHSCQNGN